MTDFVGQWNQMAFARRLPDMNTEEEVILEITVPISADSDQFRIGWSLKGVRSHRWIAITTGRAVWSRHELNRSALHLESLLACVVELIQGPMEPNSR